jgi:glycosyltransferase involved in cell wall biosynthesis
LREILRVDRKNFYRLYHNPQSSNLQIPSSNFQLQPISWSKLWTQAGLAFECLKNPPDVLFIPAHTIPLIRRPDLKTVVTIHDVGFQEYLETYQRWWGRLYEGRVSNYAARNATHLIAVSESTKKDLVEKVGVASEKITVIYEGVNHGIFRQQFIDSPKANRRLQANLAIEQLRRKYGIDGDYLLFVGTVQPRKNLARLIDAFSLLTSHFPLLNLVIVGKKGWLSDEVYAAPQKFGVGERVKFLGYVPTEDIVSLMNGAKAFVFPSLYEGFGLVVLEAMACGCPVVASNISSLPEVVEDAGILVDPYRVEDIARGVKEVLELNGEERQNLVQKGLVQARKFTWEKAARETVKIFTLVYDRNLRS